MPLGIKNVLCASVCGGLLAGLPVEAWAEPQRPASPSAAGLWEQVDDDGSVGGWFRIYERNGVYVGDLVKIFLKPGEATPICKSCSGDQKNQPTLGLTLIKGMQRRGLNYDNGSILDPRDGSVYRARMELSPDGRKLMMRGYLGIDLFGQSQNWRRLPDSAMTEATIPGPATARAQTPKGSAAPAPRTPAPGAVSSDKGQQKPPSSNEIPSDWQILRGSLQ